MAILNVGSINVDLIYRVAEIPRPGETIAASGRSTGLGGKGLNQSVAIARAGGKVAHLGAIGAGDEWIVDELTNYGVDCGFVLRRDDLPTGQAVILLSNDAENSIVILAGANRSLQEAEIAAAIGKMRPGDWVLIQNETNALDTIVDLARQVGLSVAFAAAPFAPEVVIPLLDRVNLLAVNDVEFEQLQNALAGKPISDKTALLITKGARGAQYRRGGQSVEVGAHKVQPVDTTGAGDTFLGYFLASIDGGMDIEQALTLAAAAAAIQVTRPGAAPAIPGIVEVRAFLEERARTAG